MGACDDSMELDGKLNQSQVEKRFREYQDECGHESGNSYSGRLNMCPGLTFTGKVFKDHDEAHDYVSNKAEKWDNALAVQYEVREQLKDNAKLVKLKAKRAKLRADAQVYDKELSSLVETKLKAVEFITCTGCKSRMDTRFRTRTLKCPICTASFLSASQLNKRTKLETKVSELDDQIAKEYEALKSKAKSTGKTNWLIYGVCSS